MKEKLIQLLNKPRTQYWAGILASNAVGALLVLLMPRILNVIGATLGNPSVGFLSFSLFIGIPLAMGIVSAYFWRKLNFTTANYFTASLLSTLLALFCSGFLLGEGTICLIIVSPLLYLSLVTGCLMGRFMFRDNKVQMQLLPFIVLLFVFDAITPHHYQNVVTDRVVIHARPQQVWPYVVAFPPIAAKPTFWLFKVGFPPPLQSTVAGHYLGAARHCIFEQGIVFDEKIIAYQPGHKITFVIVHQPRHPEIMGHMALQKGEMVLQDNGDGTTTLIGSSWYQLYVYPASYYDLWASRIAREVHLRVMNHIKQLAEQS